LKGGEKKGKQIVRACSAKSQKGMEPVVEQPQYSRTKVTQNNIKKGEKK